MIPIRPMLATLALEPFSQEGWEFEIKWDGFRTLAYVEGNKVTLFSRRSHDVTGLYPELASLGTRCRPRKGLRVLDGEIVAVDPEGRPDFQLLQSRLGVGPLRARELAARNPVGYVAFDLLVVGSQSIMNRPLGQRRAQLLDAVLEGDGISLSRDFGPDGKAIFAQARDRGLEGVVGKRLDSPYVPGTRTRNWLKIKVRKEQDCVILGWTQGLQARGVGPRSASRSRSASGPARARCASPPSWA